MASELVPTASIVGRLIKAAPRPVRRRVYRPGRAPGLLERGVDGVRIAGLKGKVDGTRVGVPE